MERLLFTLISVTLISALTVCSSGADAQLPSGIPPSKEVVYLTPLEKAQMCDWIAARFGGYGVRPDCTSSVFAYPDQETCVRELPNGTYTPNCQATVVQMATCVMSLPKCPTATDVSDSEQCAPLLPAC